MNILDIAIAKKLAGGGGGSGTDNYNDLSNLPKINDTTLSGNKSSSALGLQSEINSDSKLASDLVDDTNQDNKFVTSTEKNTWNAKQNAIDNSHKLSSDLVDDTNHTNKFVTSTEKNTWNAKQNAIDADHKLSSSLVSFSTAEAAALASGIDSSKVGQISTNQTNISLVQNATEELVDEGAKNKFNPEKATTDPDIFVTDENGYAFKSVSSDTRTTLRFVLNAYNNNTYVRQLGSANITSTGLFSCTFVKGSDFNFLRFGHSGAVINIQVVVDVSDLVNGETYVLSFNVTATNPSVLMAWNSTMICTKAKWDVSHNFEPHTLPNYDLTVREAEDRAALAEVIDKGAKNLWDFANANITAGGGADRITYTKTADSLTLTAVSTWAFVSYDIALKKGTYYFYGLISGLTGTDSKCVQIRVNGYQGTIIKRIDITANGAISDSFVVDTDRTITISLYVSEGEYTSSAFTISNLMICTEAAWRISQKYVPFALPNTDLTQEVNALHERTDQIQPALSFDAEVPGWYRVFTLGSVQSAVAVGAYDNSCDIVIKRLFANTNNEHHEIKLASIFENMKFTDEFSKSAVLLITNIRYVSTNDTAYIDIYYSGSVANRIICFINNNVGVSWKAVNTVSRVSETTTGETVWASYAFRDNYLSPNDPVYIDTGSLNDLTENKLYYVGANVTDKPTSDWGFVRNTKFDSNTGMQEFVSLGTSSDAYIRTKVSGTWSAWKQITNA